MADPWKEAAGKIREGMEIEGKVARLEAFGAFVELAPGVEGLVHLSELDKGGRRIRHPKDAVNVGQQIRVIVLGIDVERHRISLGLGEEPQAQGGNAPAEEGDDTTGTRRFGTFADLLKDKKK